MKGQMTDAELIREVVVKCMGWFDNFGDGKTWYKNAGYKEAGEKMAEFVCSQVDFNPLTNINHAFMVVEKLREKGYCGKMTWWDTSWTLSNSIYSVEFFRFNPDVDGPQIQHDCLGHAICLAALKTEGI